jgi:glycosyltransferase involved in cell wall biosynthesis
MVTPECGVPIDATSREVVIAGLASALVDLARHPELRRALGARARRRAIEVYGWNTCGDAMDRLYHEVAGIPTSGSAAMPPVSSRAYS